MVASVTARCTIIIAHIGKSSDYFGCCCCCCRCCFEGAVGRGEGTNIQGVGDFPLRLLSHYDM